MIRASIYRTNPVQVAELGAVAWENMSFSDGCGEDQVRGYCETLAARDGIVAPRIVIEVIA